MICKRACRFDGLDGLDGLDGMDGLDGLDGLKLGRMKERALTIERDKVGGIGVKAFSRVPSSSGTRWPSTCWIGQGESLAADVPWNDPERKIIGSP